MINIEALLQNSQNPNQMIETLLENAPHAISDATCDYLLTECFFPTLDETFTTRHRLTDNEVENFKTTFDFDSLGIKDKEQEEIKKKIEKVKSIDRAILLIEKHMSDDLKKSIVIDYIKRIWLDQNFKNDASKFISGLNKEYWKLK